MTLGRDAFKRRSAKIISWSLIGQSVTPALLTCLACEVRITSIIELGESVTLVGEAINCNRLNDRQKLVRDFVSVHSALRRLQFKSLVMYTGLSRDNAQIKVAVKSSSRPVNVVSGGLETVQVIIDFKFLTCIFNHS